MRMRILCRAIRIPRREILHLPASTRAMESFRVDVILNSLKELQEGKKTTFSFSFVNLVYTEKGRNERILCEEYKKRKELEAQLEEALATHKVASDKNSKMKEAMKVAEMKVAQTQAQVKMYDIVLIIIM